MNEIEEFDWWSSLIVYFEDVLYEEEKEND